MTATPQRAPNVSLAEFEAIFESMKNWGRWGADDALGTLNLITPDHVARACALVQSGRHVSMAIPVNTVAGPDNPSPAIHHMTQMHDWDIGSGKLRFSMCFLGMESHGDCHTHIDALNHISYDGLLYGGRPASLVTSKGSLVLDMDEYSRGVIGRGVLLDVPRYRGVPWLEPGDAVSRGELEEVERAQGVTLGEGDIMVFRTGHHRRRLELGAWDNGGDRTRAGLDARVARVIGPILPGVALWRLSEGTDYVVVPGNVGGPHLLADVVAAIRPRVPATAEPR